MKEYYKLARPDGYDFHTGKTINYRDNIGKTVECPNKTEKTILCSDTVLHASWTPNQAFVGAEIPCSVYVVSGKPLVSKGSPTETDGKLGFKILKILREIPQNELDELFGWKYSEACNPINPLKIQAGKVGDSQIKLLKNWTLVKASVRDSIWNSVWNSVGNSVGALVRISVWDSVWASVWSSLWNPTWNSIGNLVRDSVWSLVWNSVRDSGWAYAGSLFPKIIKWKHVPETEGYPYQSAVDLWKQGYVPSFDGENWRLHAGAKAQIVYTISKNELKI